MECFVGTSGWLYPWNEDGTLDWYIAHSGLNAIELNASFYRFPFPNQVKGWASKGSTLTWVVKVNRLITHVHMLNKKAEELYSRFLEILKPLDSRVAFYLFQFPPHFTTNMKERLLSFARKFDEKKMAFEFRNSTWYSFDFSELDFKGAIVTPDSPEISGEVWTKNSTIYLRFHGRESWYAYNYSAKELEEMARRALALEPKRLFAFFNNNHDMLGNARSFLRILSQVGPCKK